MLSSIPLKRFHNELLDQKEMKLIKIFTGLCILFVLVVFFAGVKLTVENQSGQQIHNVVIKYGRGTFSAGNIPDKEIRKKSLGKIGEGSTFDVMWREKSGRTCQTQFSVYFYGLSGYYSVQIKILPNGEALLYIGEEKYKPNSQRDINN